MKKAIMAVTGVVLFAFVTGHLLGNLQVFLGPARINAYAALLKSNAEILWGIRSILLVSVGLHILATVQLARLQRAARPVAYTKKNDAHSTPASRSMYLTGPMIAAFVVYHLLHLTVGIAHPEFSRRDVYSNIVLGFSQLPVSLAYIAAVGLLCMHLSHGIPSLFQSLGVSHPRYTPRIRRAARFVSLLYFAGYASIPVAVLTGVLPAIYMRL